MVYSHTNENTGDQCRSFLVYLKDMKNLKTIAFLADILCIFSRFQRQLQRNDLTVITLCSFVNKIKGALTKLQEKALDGGFG